MRFFSASISERVIFHSLFSGKLSIRALLISIASILLLAPIASALPSTETITSGTAQILVYRGATPIGSTFTNDVTGQLIVDYAGQSLDQVDITLGSDIPLSLSSPWGGYEEIVINTANIQNGAGYLSTLNSATASSYEVVVGPLDVAAVWSGTSPINPNPPSNNIPYNFSITSLNAVVSPTATTMDGLTLFFVPASGFGEVEDLLVIANLNLEFPTPIPEPNTALLLGLALAGLAGTKRQA